MKKLLLGILAIMMLGVSGCGDTSVAVVIPVAPVVYAPSITLNQFTQNLITEFIDGSISFYAPDSDIDTMTVVVFNSSGSERARTKVLLTLPGVTQGTIPFSIYYHTYPNDTYTFSIYVTDFNGNTSNQVVGTFVP